MKTGYESCRFLRLVLTMINIGQYNELTFEKIDKSGGAVLRGSGLSAGNTDQSFYLPKYEVPKGTRTGDSLTVFIYNDAKDSLKATTKKPKAVVGDFAALEVKSALDFGAFLDWGIPKDLFVPRKYQTHPLKAGEIAVVYLHLDYEKTGIMGNGKLDDFFSREVEVLEENQEVDLLVYGLSRLGASVVVANKYQGMIYRNEIFEDIHLGDKKTGFVKKIREDGKIDVALQRQGFLAASADARDVILQALRDARGFLPLHDKSSPSAIKNRLGMSKKLFKKTIGVLYKEGRITLEETGIRLTPPP
jgi:uncharacterized protein